MSSKSPAALRQRARAGQAGGRAGEGAPATSEKFECGGSEDGETSGKEMGRSSAVWSGMLEKECAYG